MNDDAEDLRGPWDLVVIGQGFAGLSAALAFLESRVGDSPRVAVIDRAPLDQRGGSTRWTTASFRVTKTGGLPDDVARVLRTTAGSSANEGYLRNFATHLPSTLAWVEANGVGVRPEGDPLVSGSDAGIHSLVGGGRGFVDTFAERATRLGARLFSQVELIGLDRAPGGRVTGVRVRTARGTAVVKTAAVVLASGGFEGDVEELARRVPGGELLEAASPGARLNTGAGIAAATAIGAARSGQPDGMHLLPVDPRSELVAPIVGSWVRGILVDVKGRRFLDEAEHDFEYQADRVAKAVLARGGLAFAITDATVRAGTPDLDALQRTDQPAIVADSIPELADRLGMRSAVLVRTLAEYNAAAADAFSGGGGFDGARTVGISPAKSNWAQPLTEPPFQALPVGAQIAFTFEGVRVDDTTHVVDGDGRKMPGLYAAGEIVGLYEGDTYPAGTSSLRALVFGRLAGLEAAAETTP
jgi:tricarballylate dehydrogenase